MDAPTPRPLVSELARYDRLVEVGIGDRPAVARALADRGRAVVGIDVDPGERTRAAERDVSAAERDVSAAERDVSAAERDAGAAEDSTGGSFEVVEGDVVSLAESDPIAVLSGSVPERGVDAVYARRLPAELQRPTVLLAERLDAACLFTTLGFEEPVVPVERRSLSGTTLYVARGRGESDRD